MLSFQTLPAEILLMIAQYVGGAHLRARVHRILLCKVWYSVTQSVAWEDADLSINAFERFLQAPTEIQAYIQSRVKDLSISGPYNNNITSPNLIEELSTQEALHEAEMRTLLQDRNTTLGDSLAKLSCTILPHLHKLTTFALNISSPSIAYTETDRTWTDTICNLITSLPKTLTNLTIDKLGTTSRFSTGLRDPHAICKVVLAKDTLPSLKHLRLRMHCICPELFSIKNIESHASLETLVIALETHSLQLGVVCHTHSCTQPQLSSEILYNDMVDAARRAVEAGCFPVLKKARIWRMREVPEEVEWSDVEWDDEFSHGNELGMDNEFGLGIEAGNNFLEDQQSEDDVVEAMPTSPMTSIHATMTLSINVAAHAAA